MGISRYTNELLLAPSGSTLRNYTWKSKGTIGDARFQTQLGHMKGNIGIFLQDIALSAILSLWPLEVEILKPAHIAGGNV